MIYARVQVGYDASLITNQQAMDALGVSRMTYMHAYNTLLAMHLITRYPTRRGIITTVNLVALDQWLAEDARLIQAEIDQWVADGNDVVTAEEVA